MRPFALFPITLSSKYSSKLLINEPFESADPAHCTVLLSPRWWATEDKRPVLVRLQAQDNSKVCPSSYRYRIQAEVIEPGRVVPLGVFESTLQKNYLDPARWIANIWCGPQDKIRLIISHPGSQQTKKLLGLLTYWNPLLKLWSGPAKLGDGHTVELNRPA